MRLTLTILAALAAGLTLGGCPGGTSVNPYLTLTESNLINAGATTDADAEAPSGDTVAAGVTFRDDIDITFINHNIEHHLRFNFLAWVAPSSLRSSEQREVLLNSGYTELTAEQRVGVAFTLPPGTYVYRGAGAGGVQRVFLGPAGNGADSVNPDTEIATFTTPDGVLIYLDPPDSCHSTAFEFTDQGQVSGGSGFGYGPSTGSGGRKTLAQFNVYQCDPFKPGLFLKTGGGARADNEFIEGQDFTVHFFQNPIAQVVGGWQQSVAGYSGIVDFSNSSGFTIVPLGEQGEAEDDQQQEEEDSGEEDANEG